ncbi:MAG: sulfatase family protein [Bacteroidota bacterium]
MLRRAFLRYCMASPLGLPGGVAAPTTKPNVILIYADDLGYGDVGCYGAKLVKTPRIDELARRGIRFTDAHSSSATCTPSRYSLLTGEYAWRKRGTRVLPGDAALILDPGRPNLPSTFKRAGYSTACVGKWHLGLGSGAVDWNGEIRPGPLEVGFDYSFIIPATGDRVPCVYVENHRVAGLDPADPIRVSYSEPIGAEPTGKSRPDLLKVKPSAGHNQTIVNGISRIGYMLGGKAARWVDEEMAATLTAKAVSFIEQSRRSPFFLYFSTHDIHVPRVPAPRFRGMTGCGVRCEAIAQLDWCVGRILGALDRLELAANTLVLFTSDNGPVIDDGYADGALEDLSGHRPAGPFRGGKYSLYEGGTRVPFIVSWPGRIRPGVSNALVGQVDMLASFAALAGQNLAPGTGPDSENLLPALLGKSQKGRSHLVEHDASRLALRMGKWKLIPGTGPQSDELYNLEADPGEGTNVAAANPSIVGIMKKTLEETCAAGGTAGLPRP